MSQLYTEDQTFEKIDYSEHFLPKGEYENCTFKTVFSQIQIYLT